MFHQLIDRGVRVGDQVLRRRDYFTGIMGRKIRRQADGDAVRTVDQGVGKLGRKHDGLVRGSFVVLRHRYGALLDVAEQQHASPPEPSFGVTGRRGGEVGRAVVAVEIEEGHQIGEGLGHARQCIGDGGVTMRVKQRHGVTDDASRLYERAVGKQALLVHVPQDATMHRLQAVRGAGHGAVVDDFLGVIAVVGI